MKYNLYYDKYNWNNLSLEKPPAIRDIYAFLENLILKTFESTFIFYSISIIL